VWVIFFWSMMIIDDWKSIAMCRTRLGVFLLNCQVVLCRIMPQEQGFAQRKALPDFLILKKVAVHFEKPNALCTWGHSVSFTSHLHVTFCLIT
jgi:hypothetical protein